MPVRVLDLIGLIQWAVDGKEVTELALFQGSDKLRPRHAVGPADLKDRPEFIRALKERQFGDFFAIYRPFWNTGGEMGNWDAPPVFQNGR
jgi:hypothetical protein